jgi:large repetitive protein
VIISDIDPVPNLTAQGNNVRWYKDEGLDTLVYEGDSFSTGLFSIGIYKYFVTQTISNCESLLSAVNLSILPLPPVSNNITTCAGQEDIMITAVGQNIRWYSDSENPLYDIRDRQTYNVVTIGDQIWMTENLNYYTPSGSWYYDNDSLRFARPYGRFYDWHTAQEVCPANWHLPSRNEWLELRDYLGGEYVAGGKMKETGYLHWDQPNTGANNESGFTALAGGYWGTTPTSAYAEFLGKYAAFLSSESNPEVWSLSYTDSELKLLYYYYDYGFSVRCLRYLSQAVASGNNLNIDFRDPGTYRFYVTQTINGIESQADTVFLRIIQNPEAPIAENIMLCEGEEVPDLTATGDNILWYNDSELTNLVHSGNIFSSGLTQPGKYKYYATQTISGCLESPADTVTLDIINLPTAPIAEDLEICEGHTDQSLHVTGENIVWYSNPQLTNVIGSGNICKPYQTDTGIYTYFVTQTISGCESQADTVLFTIKIKPGVPSVNDIAICEGEPVPDLNAEGRTIQWYSDSSLTNLVGSGNSFASSQTIPGTYTYYVSQTVSECEGIAGSVDIVIYPLPVIELGKDSTIYPDQSITLGPFSNDDSYLWNDGSQNPYYLISGSNLGTGSYQISVIVIDSNGCINTDSMEINVLPYASTNFSNISKQIKIFPNPAKEFINISLTNLLYEDILIKIFNQKGEEINVIMISPANRDDMIKLDISHLPSGMYYLQILINKGQYFGKIILL